MRPPGVSGGYAGEVGHLVLDPDGARCRCRSVGCWETVVGADALLSAAGRAPGGGLRAVASVIGDAEGGDAVAAAALDTVARWVGTGLAVVVNMLNPEVVVLGGVLGQVLAVREDAIHAALAARSLSAPRAQVRLVRPALGAASPLLGGAGAGSARAAAGAADLDHRGGRRCSHLDEGVARRPPVSSGRGRPSWSRRRPGLSRARCPRPERR